MFPVRSLYLLPLALAGASLAAQDPAPKPAEKPAETKVEAKPVEAPAADQDCTRRTHSHRIRFHHHSHSTFSAFASGVMPLRELRTSLDQRTGYGLGVQWTHDHGDWHASRTRLEWNTFPESAPVAGVRTYAKNYTLSWDHLFKLNTGGTHAYLVAGVGGSRWFYEQNGPAFHESRWTTKPAITGGIGLQVAERVTLEARYVAGSLFKTFDSNTLQASLGWRF